MKILKNTGFLLIVVLLVNACSSSTKKSDESATATEDCIYNYIDQSTDFTWTAYKFTTKKGVNGTFDDLIVISAEDAKSLNELLNSVKFTINSGSVNSNEPARDLKIAEFFFGTMANTTLINGELKDVDGTKAIVALTLNDLTLDVPATLAMSGDTVKLTATVDLKAFKAEEAVAMLNKVCSEKHTGEDGKSIFWDVVDINVKAVVKKACK